MTGRAVVLARGLGTRMRQPDASAALTAEQQRAADAGLKAMMPVGGHPFIDYQLSALADAGITGVGLVVAPDHEAVRRHFQSARPSRIQVEYLVQAEAIGTADALLSAEAWAGHEPFLTINSDNLYPVDTLRLLAALDEPGLAGFEREDLVRSGNIPADRIRSFALVRADAAGYLTAIVEKPDDGELKAAAGDGALVSMNCWRFDRRIFEFCRRVPRSARGEFELPGAVALALRHGVRFRVIPARGPVLDLSRRGDAADLEARLRGTPPRL